MFGWGVKTLTVDQLADRIGGGAEYALIDVREPDEFAGGHVVGAINVPLGTLAASASRFDRQGEVYLICHSGRRSMTAARTLRRLGFRHAYSVSGGTVAWRGKLVK